jgi:hypothetical protein
MKIEAMLWVLVLVSLALAIVSPKYRKYGLVVVGLSIMGIVAIIVLARNDEIPAPAPSNAPVQQSKRVDFERSHIEKLDRMDPEAKNRINVSEIRFDSIAPSTGSEPGTFESIRARLYNDSTRFALSDYGYYLAVQDCIAQTCTTIYDQRGLESASVPPKQARDVKIGIHAGETQRLPAFKLLGTPKVILVPSETRAYQAAPTP